MECPHCDYVDKDESGLSKEHGLFYTALDGALLYRRWSMTGGGASFVNADSKKVYGCPACKKTFIN